MLQSLRDPLVGLSSHVGLEHGAHHVLGGCGQGDVRQVVALNVAALQDNARDNVGAVIAAAALTGTPDSCSAIGGGVALGGDMGQVSEDPVGCCGLHQQVLDNLPALITVAADVSCEHAFMGGGPASGQLLACQAAPIGVDAILKTTADPCMAGTAVVTTYGAVVGAVVSKTGVHSVSHILVGWPTGKMLLALGDGMATHIITAAVVCALQHIFMRHMLVVGKLTLLCHSINASQLDVLKPIP
jgi:hypothetical protein